MGFIDDIYNLYSDQIGNSEEDAVEIALSVLDEQSRDNIVDIIATMDDNEVIQMMGIYLIEMLKMKMIQDGKLLTHTVKEKSICH